MKKLNFKPLKLSKPKLQRLRFETAGERTLNNSIKEKLKAEAGYKCQKCHKKKAPHHLEIHHKSEIHKVKKRAGIMGQLGKPTFTKKKPYHDRKDNLIVLCLECHKDMREKKK